MGAPGTAPHPASAPGLDLYNKMLQGGAPPDQVNAWKVGLEQKMIQGGAPVDQVRSYWGEGQPKAPALEAHVAGNLQRAGPNWMSDGMSAVAAGWNNSVAGLEINLAQNKAPTAYQPKGLVGQGEMAVGQELGDLPSQLVGFARGFGPGASVGARVGGIAGVAVPGAGETGVSEAGGAAIGAVVGGSVTGGATAAVFTEGQRQALLAAYNARHIHSWAEAGQVAQQAVVKTVKAGIAGGAGGLAGPVAGKLVGSVAPAAVAAMTDTLANATTNSAVTAALDHKVPDADDFFVAAGLALATHGAAHYAGQASEQADHVAKNLQDIYVRTGIAPWDAVNRSAHDPVIRQELYAQDSTGQAVHPKLTYTAKPDPETFTRSEQMTKAPPVEKEEAGQIGRPVASAASLEPVIARLETGGMRNPDAAVSPTGAVGAHQIEPGTARQYGLDPTRLHDPEYNNYAYHVIMTDLLRRTGGDEAAAMLGYNWGPGHMSKYLAEPPGERLVAIPDKTMRGGLRFEHEQGPHDETWLPAETQQYLAKARYYMGRGLQEGTPGAGEEEFPGHDGTPDWQASQETEEAKIAGDRADLDKEMDQTAQERAGSGIGASAGAASRWSDASWEEVRDEMLSNVGEVSKASSSLGEKTQDFSDEVVRQFVSELNPARRFDSIAVRLNMLDREKDFGLEDHLRRSFYGSDGIAANAIGSPYGGVRIVDGHPTQDAAVPTYEIVQKEVHAAGFTMKDLKGSLLGARSVNLTKRGVESKFNQMAAERGLQTPEGQKLDVLARRWTEVANSGIAMLRDSGWITPDAYDRMEAANPIYTSFRQFQGDPGGAFKKNSGWGISKLLTKIKGSDGQVVDPISSAIDNTRIATRTALQNLARVHLVEQFEANPDLAAIYGARKTSGQTLDPNDDAFTQELKQYGFKSEEELERARAAYGDLAAARLEKNLAANEFSVRRAGVPETWSVESPELASLMRDGATSPIGAGILGASMKAVAHVMRSGVAVGDFAARMTLWHQQNITAMDSLHPLPYAPLLQGIVPALTKNPDYWRAMASGAIVHLGADLSPEMMSKTMERSVVEDETGFAAKAWNVVKHPIEASEMLGTRLQAATNVGYMKVAESKGIDQAKAAMRSRKAGLDYAERGANQLVNYWASVVPFMRPRLLGFKQAAEAIANPKLAAGTAAAILATVVMPKVLNYVLNTVADQWLPDDKKYSNIDRNERATEMILPSVLGQRFHVRMPAVYGAIVGDPIERAMDAMFGQDPKAFAGYLGDLSKEFVPPVIPPIAQAPLENASNFNFQTGRALVPESLQHVLPQDRYTDYTSQVGRDMAAIVDPGLVQIGAGEGFSPIQFDHLVHGWSGGLGDTALATLGAPLAGGGVDGLKEAMGNIFVRGLALRQNLNFQSVNDVYSDLTSEQQKYNSARSRLKEEARSNGQDPDSAADMVPKTQKLSDLEGAADTIRYQFSLIKGYKADKTMTVDEKRQLTEAATQTMLDAAKAVTAQKYDADGDPVQ